MSPRPILGGGKLTIGLALAAAFVAAPAIAQTHPATPSDVTFTKDIAPILQRSCQTCHRPDGVAPMSLVTYEEARPWARAMKQRTGIGPRAGVMPPWYIEKNIGIQEYKDDPSLPRSRAGPIQAHHAAIPRTHRHRACLLTAATGASASPISSSPPRRSS